MFGFGKKFGRKEAKKLREQERKQGIEADIPTERATIKSILTIWDIPNVVAEEVGKIISDMSQNIKELVANSLHFCSSDNEFIVFAVKS